jgi:hypothetical protein
MKMYPENFVWPLKMLETSIKFDKLGLILTFMQKAYNLYVNVFVSDIHHIYLASSAGNNYKIRKLDAFTQYFD